MNWPREERKVEDFTPAGKKCLDRLKEQIKARLPPLTALRCLSVLLDPATKPFAESKILGTQLFEETKLLLKIKHRAAYKAFHKPSSVGQEVESQMTTATGKPDKGLDKGDESGKQGG